MDEAAGFRSRFGGHASPSAHPIAAAAIAGLALRFAIMGLAVVYDSGYWAIVVRNMNAGGGLYDLDGYFYTPVWGYVIGLMNGFENAVLGFGDMSESVVDAMYLEGAGHQTTSTITYVWFNYLVKLPLVACDLVTAYLVYVLAMDVTGDRKKASYGFALAFLCPVVMGSTSIIGMPDTISAMFAMLCLVLVRRDRFLIAGMCFAMAAMTKFFPAFLLFPLVAYVMAKSGGDLRSGLTHTAIAGVGAAAAAAVIFMPQLMEGGMAECFRFLTDRTGSGKGSTVFDTAVGGLRVFAYSAIILFSALVARSVFRERGEGLEASLLRGSLLVMAACMLFPPTTQYIVVVVPLLAYHIAAVDRGYIVCWKLLFVGAILVLTTSLCTDLMPFAVSWGFPSVSSLLRWFDAWNAGAGALTAWNVQFVAGSIFQYLGSLTVLLMAYRRGIGRAISAAGHRAGGG